MEIQELEVPISKKLGIENVYILCIWGDKCRKFIAGSRVNKCWVHINWQPCQGFRVVSYAVRNEEPLKIFEPQLIDKKICLRKAKLGMLIGQFEAV